MGSRLLLLIILVTSFTLFTTPSVQACTFIFNHQRIEATLGTTGTVAVRVLIDHNDCTLEGGIDGMQFGWENVQVLATTPWKEVSKDLYERSFQVSLSNIGAGHFMIFKDCSREGYDELVLPIQVLAGGTIWDTAFNGKYPYTTPDEPDFIKSTFTIVGQDLINSELSINVPVAVPVTNNVNTEIAVYYRQKDDAKKAILIVGPDFYYRF